MATAVVLDASSFGPGQPRHATAADNKRGEDVAGGDGAIPALLASGRGPVTLTRAGARAVLVVAVARAMGAALAVAVAAGGGGGEGEDEGKGKGGVDWWWRGRGCWRWHRQHGEGGGNTSVAALRQQGGCDSVVATLAVIAQWQ